MIKSRTPYGGALRYIMYIYIYMYMHFRYFDILVEFICVLYLKVRVYVYNVDRWLSHAAYEVAPPQYTYFQ